MKRLDITLSKIKKLIDINGDIVNFNVSFRVRSHEGLDFESAIVDQNTLENSPTLPFRSSVNGEISGTMTVDSGLPLMQYFLVLKAEQTNPVQVEIAIEPTVQKPLQSVSSSPALSLKSFTQDNTLLILGLIFGGSLLYVNRKKVGNLLNQKSGTATEMNMSLLDKMKNINIE